MKTLYTYSTEKGLARIAYHAETKRFHAIFNDEDLGNYVSAPHAIDDLAGGYTFKPSSGIDISTLGIPCDTAAWTRAR